LSVIKGNIKTIKEKVNECDKLYDNIDIFYNIDTAVNIIQEIVNTTKETKHLNFSNGNKTLYDLILGSINSLKTFQRSNFKYSIDPRLKTCTLDHDSGFTNAIFLSIFINLIKNSLESRSSNIVVNSVTDKNRTQIYIADDGHGVRDKESGLIISKKYYNKIFEANYSTKDEAGNSFVASEKMSIIDKIKRKLSFYFHEEVHSGSSRGVGLYLSKQLLLRYQGNIELLTTNESGSVFLLNVKSEPFLL
jgi:sensor histidine kinase regulating citrate/malate metabolism